MSESAAPKHPSVAGIDRQVDAWLEPLGDPPCGENMEYELDFLEFSQAAEGKPETQFSAAEPPVWSDVESRAVALMERTRDLRIVVPWIRSQLYEHGLPALAPGVRLLHGLMDRFWDRLHPELDPDDGDPFARITAVSSLAQFNGLLGDTRECPLLVDRRLAGLRVRDVELALDRLAPKPDEEPPSLAHVRGVLTDPDLAEPGAQLRSAVVDALEQLKELQRLMQDRFGFERTVDLKPIRGMLDAVQGLLPESFDDSGAGSPEDTGDNSSSGDAGAEAPRTRRGGGGAWSVESREDALKAIGLVCSYLERHEPTNPAQLLLRRAERLIDKNFLQLVRDLAPDAINEVARIMGVDPDSITSDH
ncbi:type VI secretion system protein TssA [Ideonella sp. 4Y11]|uniref:Type VI secretion system protein TssA n=1 Tax=Ideonella aquatica TaxID=2824119 RepID=A0A941BLU2_9BURK|nr:type VI secretion system protein TssA [Ideonella aquatica]MBQ0961318.1 type VI secretion system protein TssA [Ideonella aquatica]